LLPTKGTPIAYKSLEESIDKIRILYEGVSGVYMLINTLNPLRVYVGSSLNMGRRFKEYYLLTLGLRKIKSISEKEIANTKPNH
jgi:hypothetical protein